MVPHEDGQTPPAACELAGVCSGCLWEGTPYAAQLDRKRDALAAAWAGAALDTRAVAEADIVTVAERGLRDRVDRTLRRRGGQVLLGLDDRERGGGAR